MPSDIDLLRLTIRIAGESRASGNHPFGALLAGPGGEVLLTSGNTYAADRGVGHAETNVARAAAQRYEPDFLARCTLVTSVEPCCMCSGTQYWAGIGRLVYGMSETRLRATTGRHPENPTLDVPCREVFSRGQKPIRVWGPIPAIEDELAAVHARFWLGR